MERLRAARFQALSGIADYLTLGHPPARFVRLRNYGVHLAAGEYIAFLDDGNDCEPDHLAGLMQAICVTLADTMNLSQGVISSNILNLETTLK